MISSENYMRPKGRITWLITDIGIKFESLCKYISRMLYVALQDQRCDVARNSKPQNMQEFIIALNNGN